MWPYLLGHHAFGSTESERTEQDANTRTRYETTMSEWLAVEAIVRQRDREQAAANMAKLSSESTNSEIPLVGELKCYQMVGFLTLCESSVFDVGILC